MDEDACTSICIEDENQICGNSWHNSVYQVGDIDLLAYSTSSTSWSSTSECGIQEVDNYHDSWCSPGCATVVTIDSCDSGLASLVFLLNDVTINNCFYSTYAQYECMEADFRLLAYWDSGSCGHAGDDANAAWCGGVNDWECPADITVDTSLCPSGSAHLAYMLEHITVDDCYYAYYAQFICSHGIGFLRATLYDDYNHQDNQPHMSPL